MKILFLHRGFPGQFKYMVRAFSQLPQFEIRFITADKTAEIPNVQKYTYTIPLKNSNNCSELLKDYNLALLHGQEVAKILRNLKKEGYIPDIIVGHSWGNNMFVKDIYPNVPLLCYFEWYQSDFVSQKELEYPLTDDRRIQIRCDNSRMLNDLVYCDGGLSPLQWQKMQFPKEFQDKIRVIYDGIETNECAPNPNAVFEIDGKTFTQKDEIITYATRGMEPYRGFPQFMYAVEKLLVQRPNAHFLIGGVDKVFYGKQSSGSSYKQDILRKLKLDKNRVHFVGELNYSQYLSLLQVSSAHIYLTYPFVLSWSLMEAMSVACPLIVSNTEPLLEVIQDGFNGLMVDMNNVDMLVEKINFALDNKEQMAVVRQNARNTILAKYDVKNLLMEHLNYITELVQEAKK